MKSTLAILLLLALTVASSAVQAQVEVTPNPNHDELLRSADPKAAANKRLVYDFWREVFEGGHLNLVEKYFTSAPHLREANARQDHVTLAPALIDPSRRAR